MLKGVDVSHHNGIGCVNTISAENSEIEFFIIKATEGRTYTDPQVLRNVSAAKNNNKLIGLYHYARPENNDPIEEAMHYINVCNSTGLKIGEYIMVLDYEGIAHDIGQEWALQWLDYVYRLTGVKPIIYLSASYVKKYTKVCRGDYGLWIAQWSKELNVNLTSPWQQQALWQYDNKGYDKNIFYGTREQWKKYCKSTKVAENVTIGCGCCGCCHKNNIIDKE